MTTLVSKIKTVIADHVLSSPDHEVLGVAATLAGLVPAAGIGFLQGSMAGKALFPTANFERRGDNTFDRSTGLLWSPTLCKGKNVNHAEAEEACKKLGPEWRLPTVYELRELVDYSKHNPAIDTEAFPDTKSDYYWTSTLHAANPDYAWFVGFNNGYVHDCNRDFRSACVRAVRASQ